MKTLFRKDAMDMTCEEVKEELDDIERSLSSIRAEMQQMIADKEKQKTEAVELERKIFERRSKFNNSMSL